MNEAHIAVATLTEELSGYFQGTFPCDDIPRIFKKKPVGIIVNTDLKGTPGSHWVAIHLACDGSGEYFDSFGFPPLVAHIREYLNTMCPLGYTYSPHTLQSPYSSSCGAWSLAFIKHRFRNKPYNEFINGFSDNLSINETHIKNWNDILFTGLLQVATAKRQVAK